MAFVFAAVAESDMGDGMLGCFLVCKETLDLERKKEMACVWVS